MKSTISRYDIRRIKQCFNCKYFDECHSTIPEPEDDADGNCKTVWKFIERDYGVTCSKVKSDLEVLSERMRAGGITCKEATEAIEKAFRKE